MQEILNKAAVLLNIPTMCVIFAVVLLGWSIFGAIAYDRMRKIAWNFLILAAAAILFVTILARTKIQSPKAYLIPFSTFQRGQNSSELYCYMIFNIFMFVPVGLTLPFALTGKAAKRVLLTILFGFLFSLFIETMQNLLSVGYLDVDDIIANTLGAAIGSLSYLITMLLMKTRLIKPRLTAEPE